MRKLIVYCLAAILSCLLVSAQNGETWKMVVLSDIHIMAPELLQEDGPAFQQYITYDRKMLKESVSLLKTAVDAIISEQPDAVLVTGDLTKDGEKVSHELVAQHLLKPLREQGIPVYVIPGNHDVNNPHAVIFLNDTVKRTETVSPEEFARCYNDYGYGQAIARDPYSLSYVVQLHGSTRLLAIDACKYEENDYSLNTCVTGGRIKPETMEFIRKQTEDAKAHGCHMLTMIHHGLVQHWEGQESVMADYLVDNWKQQAETFAGLGLRFVFTGHFHAQDIASWSKGKQAVYDIETGSTVSYPMPYRIINFGGGQMKIATRHIESIPGFTSPGALQQHALRFAKSSISSIAHDMLPKQIPDVVAERVSNALEKAYTAHLTGDENLSTIDAATLETIGQQMSSYSPQLGSALKMIGTSLYTDIAPADNNVTIEINETY